MHIEEMVNYRELSMALWIKRVIQGHRHQRELWSLTAYISGCRLKLPAAYHRFFFFFFFTVSPTRDPWQQKNIFLLLRILALFSHPSFFLISSVSLHFIALSLSPSDLPLLPRVQISKHINI